jgi:glycosyltransferase involved in cell wall biosynthesis
MEKVKDPLNLAKAFVDIVISRPDLKEKMRLVMIGSGTLYNEVIDTIHRAGLNDCAWIPGHRSDIPELMRLFDIFVLPSKAEGISNTILEAMSTGLPIIATKVGGNTELVVGGKNGKLVLAKDRKALAEAIIEYIENRELIKEHGINSRKRIEAHYSMDSMIYKYQMIYDSGVKMVT